MNGVITWSELPIFLLATFFMVWHCWFRKTIEWQWQLLVKKSMSLQDNLSPLTSKVN